jgi:hypothetical protein
MSFYEIYYWPAKLHLSSKDDDEDREVSETSNLYVLSLQLIAWENSFEFYCHKHYRYFMKKFSRHSGIVYYFLFSRQALVHTKLTPWPHTHCHKYIHLWVKRNCLEGDEQQFCVECQGKYHSTSFIYFPVIPIWNIGPLSGFLWSPN